MRKLAFIVVNIILIVSIGVIFSSYVSDNTHQLKDISIKDVEIDASYMLEYFEQYLLLEQQTVDNIVYYAEQAELDEEEMQLYLETMKYRRGSTIVLDVDTCKGYQVKTGKLYESITEPVDYSDNPSYWEFCNKAKEGIDKEEFNVTELLESEKLKKSSNIAIYEGATIEGKKKAFIYLLSLSEITQDIFEGLPDENKQGILINGNGDLLSSPQMLPKEMHMKESEENYYEFLERKFGEEESQIVRETLENNDKGNFVLTDTEGNTWVYSYAHLTKNSDWSYLYVQQHHEMGMPNRSKAIILEVIALMVFICGMDIVIIFWQNQKLRRSLAELVKANAAKNDFISNVSHEIRTPINAIIGMDEMIIRESTEKEIIQYAHDIKNASKTLLGIINDILDFSRMESGKTEIIPTEYEVASMVNDLLNMVESRAESKNLELKVNVNPHLPHLLYGDELRNKQIILNILTNAVKYTEKGSVTLTVDYEKLDEERISLYVSVKDTGIGLKPEDKERLCKPFERLDETRNRTIEGTGLGMSIVTSLLQQMNSSLTVESTYGEGSDFSFHLEQKVADWKEMGDLNRVYLEAKSGEKEEAILRASKARVLVVDDTPINLTVAAGLLKRTGIQVECAQSGKECLELIRKTKYHVILLDHRMPEMDGVETLHRMKEMESPNKETPVIALTANAVSGACEYYISEGFSDFLPKPIHGNRLERMLLKYLPEDVLDTEEEAWPELDEKAGITACGSEEIYQTVLREFADSVQERAAEIRGYFEAGDIKNYTTKVHALKSSARLAGVLKLSEQARYLEQCGDEGKLEEIEAKTEELLTNYMDIGIKLKRMLDTDKNIQKKEIDLKQLKEALEAILEFNEAFDFDNVDLVMDSLSEYSFSTAEAAVYEELKSAVLEVNQERIREIVQRYLGGISGE